MKNQQKNKLLYKKLMLCLVLGIAANAGVAHAESKKISARWNCFEVVYPVPTVPTVRAVVYKDGSATIEANDIFTDAVYQQEGLTHRWDFDADDNGTYEAAFTIQPNSKGLYYYFGDESAVKPSLTTK